MDPQQKLLLQCVYRALEDAGIPLEKVSGTRTGVYIGNINKQTNVIAKSAAFSILKQCVVFVFRTYEQGL